MDANTWYSTRFAQGQQGPSGAQGISGLGAGQGDAERGAIQGDAEHGVQVHKGRDPTTSVEGDKVQGGQAQLRVGHAQGGQDEFKVSELDRPTETPSQWKGC